ncbi:MAG: hypothetical protein K2Y02_06145 [Burkholderiaceae bacterium]|nr:hypothetical protein [Burkholderiaceae bacterium]
MSSLFKAAWLPMCALAGLHVIWAPALAQAPVAASPATVVAPAASAADPAAAVPAALYRSPFTGYRSFTEPAVAPWRDTNDLVRRRGGWRAYAREAGESAAEPLPAASSPSPASGHSGHRMK